MPAFPDPKPEDTVRHPDWDSGVLPDGTPWEESATFKPQISEGDTMEVALLLEPELARMEERAKAEGWSEANHTTMKNHLELVTTLYIYLDHWTLRRSPTREQAAAGLPGDIVPLTIPNLIRMDARQAVWLWQEMMARLKREAGPAATTFRPRGATGDPVRPKRGRVRGGHGTIREIPLSAGAGMHETEGAAGGLPDHEPGRGRSTDDLLGSAGPSGSNGSGRLTSEVLLDHLMGKAQYTIPPEPLPT